MLPLIIVAALLAAPQHATPPRGAGPYLGHGVSQALAMHRARDLGEIRYALSLDVTAPDVRRSGYDTSDAPPARSGSPTSVTAPDSAVGRVSIRFDLKAREDVILDFRGRRLTAATANGRSLPKGAANGAHIRIPLQLLSLGENRLELAFVADIAPSGASIIRFHDQNDGSDYLYTLLVPADANQLFPCFDQPDLKARVTFALTAPGAWRALANGPEIGADTVAGGAVTHRFAETQPLSTYQIAFAAGPWHVATATAGGRTIAAWVRRSRAREADLDSLLAINLRALAWMERYFARAYPFDKFAFLLAPAFPFGGMEHPGAVFYNEDRFIFRERPTLPQWLGRTSTVLHEVAHMWFGDLVTMKWFDDLWLKEGFATYMAAKALADLDSAGGAWKAFYLANKPAAYGVDQTAGTTPLWQALANLDQAKSAYGAIVYNKAPAVLKQLNYLVGEPAFRAGVQTFLARHAFANATWRDLLTEIGRAADRPLDDFGHEFILRPGMPEVEQRVSLRSGQIARLALVQRPVRALSGPGPWPMRTQLLLWYADAPPAVIPVELSGAVTEVAEAAGKPAPGFVYANAGDYGYMLTRLDSASLAALEGGALGRVSDAFLRAMLWGALWDEVRAARMDPAAYVGLALRELPGERDEQIVPRVLGHVRRALAAYLGDAARERLQPEVERFLWAVMSDAAAPFGLRKAYLDAYVGTAATAAATATLAGLVSSDSAAGAPTGNPTRWDAVTRLLVLGAPDAERLLAAQAARDSSPDGRRRAFVAGAAHGDSTTKLTYFLRYFGDASLNEDWASGSLGAFNALEHRTLTLPYLRSALDSLRYIQANRRIFFLGAWLGAFLGGQTGDAALATVRRFLAGRGVAPDLRRKVEEYADELERTVEIRRRFARG